LIAVSACRFPTALLLSLIVAFPLSADAQTPETGTLARRTIQATRLLDTERIALDGRLDEEVWTRAARPGYIISLNGEWNQIDLAEGSFASNVFRGVADTQFTPFMARSTSFSTTR
jgi:hypothetical protein